MLYRYALNSRDPRFKSKVKLCKLLKWRRLKWRRWKVTSCCCQQRFGCTYCFWEPRSHVISVYQRTYYFLNNSLTLSVFIKFTTIVYTFKVKVILLNPLYLDLIFEWILLSNELKYYHVSLCALDLQWFIWKLRFSTHVGTFRDLDALLFYLELYGALYFWGRVSNYNQSETGKHCFLPSDWLKSGSLVPSPEPHSI